MKKAYILLILLFSLYTTGNACWWEDLEEWCEANDWEAVEEWCEANDIEYNGYNTYEDFMANGSDEAVDDYLDYINYITYSHDEDGNIVGVIATIDIVATRPTIISDPEPIWEPEPEPELEPEPDTEPRDCAGVEGGSAYLDNCKVCVGGSTGKTACIKDCAGVYGGTAHLDLCLICVGGTTEKIACKVPCPTSKDDLKKVFPNASDASLGLLANIINKYGSKFAIDTKEKLQHFLAQAGHECGGFINLGISENLNYSTPERLMIVWPSRFSQTDKNIKDPDDFVNKPVELGNYIYANRMGNGNTESGDGYKYRGRGIFQLTGMNNYNTFNDFYNDELPENKDIISNPDLLSSDQTISIISALWFYKVNVLDKITIDENTTVEKITKLINGGSNGLPDRISKFNLTKLNIDCND